MDQRRRRIDALNTSLRKTDELLDSLARTSKMRPMVSLLAREKIKLARVKVESELEALCLGPGTEEMEVDEHPTVASEKKNVKSSVRDHAPVATKRKRCDEMVGEQVGSGMSLEDELATIFSGLKVEAGMTVLECITEGEGGGAKLDVLGSMGVIVGKRISTFIGELSYLMCHGEELARLWEAFDKGIQAEAAIESNIFSRRVSNLLNGAKMHLVHKTEGIIPELHDVIFEEAGDLIEKCSSAVSETEYLLALKKMPTASIQAGQNLEAVVAELMEVNDNVSSIEDGVMGLKEMFTLYGTVAELKINEFVDKIEECLDLVWENLKCKKPRHGD